MCVYETWHHANRLRAINFIIIPLTFVLIHSSHAKKTFPTVCCLYMKQISPDWSVSGFLEQSRFLRLILMWCDVMRCYPLLFYSSFRCASLSVARLPRLLWRTSLLNTTFTRTVVNWKSCIFLLKHNVIAYLFVSLNTHYIRIDFSEHTVLSKYMQEYKIHSTQIFFFLMNWFW